MRLLGQLLEPIVSTGSSPPVLKFRADNYDDIAALDDLERRRLLRREGPGYVVDVIALPLLETEAARGLLQRMERLYAALRQRYMASQDAPVSVMQLAAEAQVPSAQTIQALCMMTDVSLWNRGRSTDLTDDGAYLIPAEELLKYADFAAMLREVRSWNISMAGTSTPIFGEPVPERLSTRNNVASGSDTPESGEIAVAWPAVRACLEEFRFDDIKGIVGLAGIDLTAVAHLVQKEEGGATKGQLLSAVDGQFGQMPMIGRNRFLTILIEEVLRRRPQAEEKLSEYLSRLGWSFASQTLVPLEIFDPDALEWTPYECRKDLMKAAQRFRDGDLSGAISAACGAVDAATSMIYEQRALGDPTQASFQQRCRRAAQAKGVLTELRKQLSELGWGQAEIEPFQKNLEGALNQGAYVLQTLRSHMGDVHGSKPILGPLVFDCLRWAELLVASLTSERVGGTP